MPKYLFTIIEDESLYSDSSDADLGDVMAQHSDFAAAVSAAGAKVLGGEALQPMATATFLRKTRTADVSVVDNPSPDVKEVVGGYYLIEATDDAHAVEIGKLCPAPGGYIEVRPIWEFDAPA